MLAAPALQAGVGIGTTSPDASAILDVTATNRGLLPPRLPLTGTTDTTTVASPAEGLIVYNTATVSDVTPGIYLWDGTKWAALKTESNSHSHEELPGFYNVSHSGATPDFWVTCPEAAGLPTETISGRTYASDYTNGTDITSATMDGTSKIILLEELDSGGAPLYTNEGVVASPWTGSTTYWNLTADVAAQKGIRYFFAAKHISNLTMPTGGHAKRLNELTTTDANIIGERVQDSVGASPFQYEPFSNQEPGAYFTLQESYINSGRTVDTNSRLLQVLSTGSAWFFKMCGSAIQK